MDQSAFSGQNQTQPNALYSPETTNVMPSTTTTGNDRLDLTPKQPQRYQNASNNTPTTTSVRPGSPLKQEVFASPVLESSLDYYFSPSSSPTLSRDTRAFDQAQRWTILSREAEADEVSILSVTSEEKNYYALLLPDDNEPRGAANQDQINDSRTSSRISGFTTNAVEDEYEYNNLRNEREDSIERFSEVEYDETHSTQELHVPAPEIAPPPTELHPPPFAVNPPSDPPL